MLGSRLSYTAQRQTNSLLEVQLVLFNINVRTEKPRFGASIPLMGTVVSPLQSDDGSAAGWSYQLVTIKLEYCGVLLKSEAVAACWVQMAAQLAQI